MADFIRDYYSGRQAERVRDLIAAPRKGKRRSEQTPSPPHESASRTATNRNPVPSRDLHDHPIHPGGHPDHAGGPRAGRHDCERGPSPASLQSSDHARFVSVRKSLFAAVTMTPDQTPDRSCDDKEDVVACILIINEPLTTCRAAPGALGIEKSNRPGVEGLEQAYFRKGFGTSIHGQLAIRPERFRRAARGEPDRAASAPGDGLDAICVRDVAFHQSCIRHPLRRGLSSRRAHPAQAMANRPWPP